MRLKLHRHV
jgi:hypothetical protein